MKQFLPCLLLLFSLSLLRAQQPLVVANGLPTPAGVSLDEQGRPWVVSAGSRTAPGRIFFVEPNGTLQLYMTDLPSSADTTGGEIAGPWRLMITPAEVYILIGEVNDPLAGHLLRTPRGDWSPGMPLTPENATVVADFTTFALGQGYAGSNPFDMLLDAQGRWVVADAAANALIRYDPIQDTMGLLAGFAPIANPLPFGPPAIEAVPTALVGDPAGGYLVGQLTGFPFADGVARVFQVSETGTVTEFAGDLTLITDLARDPADGELVALQMARYGEQGFEPDSGQLIKLRSDGSRSVMLDKFGPAVGFAFDGQGGVYVTHLFFGQLLHFTETTALQQRDPALQQATLSPNPTGGPLVVEVRLNETRLLQMELYDTRGVLLAARPCGQLPPGLHRLPWDLTAFPAGRYWCRLQTGQGSRILPVVKQ